MGIRGNIILRLALVATVVAVAGAWTLARTLGSLYHDAARQRAEAVVELMALPIAPAIATGQLAHVEKLVTAASDRSSQGLDLIQVTVYDTEGRRIAGTVDSTRRIATGQRDDFVTEALAAGRHFSRLSTLPLAAGGTLPVLRAATPATSGGRRGTVVATFSLEPLQRRIETAERWAVGSALALGLLLFFALSLLLSRAVITPVRRLGEAARRVEAAVDDQKSIPHFELSAEQRRGDELSALAQALSRMTARLAAHSEDLKHRVAERTDALARANNALKVANRRLEHLANTDELTGLHNRRHFDQRLDFEVERSRRGRHPLSLLMVDLDHFKNYNDTFGHPEGDKLLSTLAGIFVGALRRTDIVSRYGGEEFAVILVDTDRNHALSAANKLRDAVRSYPFPGRDSQPFGRVTISLGVASYPEDATDARTLIEAADSALYEAKERGRDKAISAADADVSTMQLPTLSLRKAVARGSERSDDSPPDPASDG